MEQPDELPFAMQSSQSRDSVISQESMIHDFYSKDGLIAVLSQFGVVEQPPQEQIDFTYVTVTDDETERVDGFFSMGLPLHYRHDNHDNYYDNNDNTPPRGDILSIILAETTTPNNVLLETTRLANEAVAAAADAKQQGDMEAALDAHSAAAKLFRDAALMVKEKNGK
jgi:hypothetical protein